MADNNPVGRGALWLLAAVVVIAFIMGTTHYWHTGPAQNPTGPAQNPYVNYVTMHGHDNTQHPRTWKAYHCTKRLAWVYVKTGASVTKYGSKFSLTNQPDPDKFFRQQAVVLNVRLSESTAVEAIIVLSKAPFGSADNEFSGHEDDKLAPVQHLSPGKSLTYTLHTNQYVHEQPKGDVINAVTLCLTRPG